MRMLMNNLDPEVAEHPDQLIVYGGSGRAARSWAAFDGIVASLRDLEDAGLVRREVLPTRPPSTVYRATRRATAVLGS